MKCGGPHGRTDGRNSELHRLAFALQLAKKLLSFKVFGSQKNLTDAFGWLKVKIVEWLFPHYIDSTFSTTICPLPKNIHTYEIWCRRKVGRGWGGFIPSPSDLKIVMLDFNYICWDNRGIPKDHLTEMSLEWIIAM